MNAVMMNSEAVKPRLQGKNKFREFGMLVRREIWENKGAIVWTPIILAALQVIATLGFLAVILYKSSTGSLGRMIINGQEVPIGNANLHTALSQMSTEDVISGGRVADIFMYMATTWPLLIAGIVAFFYCLGALYDERKDRSILFWKSMPVSDLQTVASKAFVGLVVIPVFAVVISVVLILIYTSIFGLVATWQGGNAAATFANANPLKVVGSVISGLPLHFIWALPAAGWLLLCSAFAKRMPILWAVGIPLAIGVLIAWVEGGASLGRDISLSAAYFRDVVYHILPSIVPGSFFPEMGNVDIDFGRNLMPYSSPVIASMYSVLLKPATWIGAIAGIAMLWGAVQLRRRNGAI